MTTSFLSPNFSLFSTAFTMPCRLGIFKPSSTEKPEAMPTRQAASSSLFIIIVPRSVLFRRSALCVERADFKGSSLTRGAVREIKASQRPNEMISRPESDCGERTLEQKRRAQQPHRH